MHAATPPHRLTAALQQHAALRAAQQQAQQTSPAPAPQPAPIERQDASAQTGPTNSPLTPEALARQRLLSAHTLYLAQSTQDANFPASPDDAYNLVLANLKNWGHYQLVDSVAQADLVLQLRDAVKTSVVDSTDNTGPTVYYLPSASPSAERNRSSPSGPTKSPTTQSPVLKTTWRSTPPASTQST